MKKRTKQWLAAALAIFLCAELIYNSEDCKNFLTNQLAAFLSVGQARGLPHADHDLSSPEVYIAHAGGRTDGHDYTNSREALENSLSRGYRYVELDLLVTRDGHIIAAHDWKTFAKITGNRTDRTPPTLNEAVASLIHGRYHVLSGEDIARIMRANPHLVLVTDKIEDYALLAKELPFQQRMIVEVFGRWAYLKCLWYGFTPAYSLPWKLEDLEKVLGLEARYYTVSGAAWRGGYENMLAHIETLRSRGKNVLLFTAGGPEGLDMEKDDFLEKNFPKYFNKIYTDAERRFAPQD